MWLFQSANAGACAAWTAVTWKIAYPSPVDANCGGSPCFDAKARCTISRLSGKVPMIVWLLINGVVTTCRLCACAVFCRPFLMASEVSVCA